MPAYDNNKNPMPEKLCIRNENQSTSSIAYDSYVKIYEAMCKREFISQCKLLLQIYAGNHMFKIKVPETMVYTEDYYTIRGAQHAVMFMHVIALITGDEIYLQDKDFNNLVRVRVSETHGYMVHMDKYFIDKYSTFGADNEVKQCLEYNGTIWRMLNKFSYENYKKNFVVYGKPITQNLGFVYAIKNAAEISLANGGSRHVYIYDANENVICFVNSDKDNIVSVFEPTGRQIGTYSIEQLSYIQASTIKSLIEKITTNIEYICDKLLDDKYDKTEAGVDISKLSQNIRSLI